MTPYIQDNKRWLALIVLCLGMLMIVCTFSQGSPSGWANEADSFHQLD
jgi:hypothetical protein